jgi:molybdopterin converting factor subunit 1
VITVRVLYFAAIRELRGRDEESLALPESVRTIAELGPHLERAVPALEGHLAHVRLARNESFADPDELLQDGDRVALIPPVSGG